MSEFHITVEKEELSMRNEPVTMNDFADSVREELQNDLGVLFPGIKVVVQQVDKIQGDSYLGVRIDRPNGMASPVLNLEPHFYNFIYRFKNIKMQCEDDFCTSKFLLL